MGDKERYCVCRSTDSKSFMIACDKCEEWFHGKCIKVTPDAASNIKRYYCVACRAEDSTLRIKYKKHKQDESSNKQDAFKKQTKAATQKVGKKSTRQCGQCENCSRSDDCGVCDFCKDSKKYGGPNKIRQKCRLKQCKVYGIKSEEKLIDDDNDPDDSRLSSTSLASTPTPVPTPAPPPPKKKPPAKTKKPVPKQKTTPKPKRQYTRRKTDENSSLASRQQTDEVARQCFGPRCVNAARPGSKYCSDDCGLKLAAMRLVDIMPARIKQWQSSPCVAEQKNRKQLDEIREKMLEAKSNLEKLEERSKILDRIVERGKQEKVKEEESEEENSNSEEEEEEEDMELFIYCVTCGHEVRQRNAIKHMEKCFVKAERDMSFAGSFKSLIGGDTICDHFNASSRTYCKRLKVICPEHSKEPKVADDEICGCPLTKDLFTEISELCKTSKKNCVAHFKWERLRRAEIDADKVRQWMRIDELLEKERLIRAAMSNRAGVMGLLLHQTVDHEAMQTHHKHHTPLKPAETKPMNKTSSTNPGIAVSKDLSKDLSTDGQTVTEVKESMEVDSKPVIFKSTEATAFVSNPEPPVKQNPLSSLRAAVSQASITNSKLHNALTQNQPKIVTIAPKPPITVIVKPATASNRRTLTITHSQQSRLSTEHDYSHTPTPSTEHDYCS